MTTPQPEAVKTLAEVERAHICQVVSLCQGNKSKAARLLGITNRTVYTKIKQYRAQGFLVA